MSAFFSIRRLNRNAEAPFLFESFLVAAVSSFLGIRWFLALTGYPKIGSNGIHIAHMLWGGLLMLLALMLLLAFLNRSVEHAAAIIAGLGFGTFIDEIGKFVTSDNNYFFRPAISLIYAVFVLAFLVSRTLIGQRPLNETEALANAVDLLARAPSSEVDPDDLARIRHLLSLADQKSGLTKLAKSYLGELDAGREHEGPIETLRRRVADGYAAIMARPWAEPAITIGFILYAASAVVGVVLVATSTPAGATGDPTSFATLAQVVSTSAGAALVGVGVVRLPSSRIAAFHWFMRGLLVWILLTQVFVFYSSQLAGLGGLAIDLVAYGSLRYAMIRETVASHQHA